MEHRPRDRLELAALGRAAGARGNATKSAGLGRLDGPCELGFAPMHWGRKNSTARQQSHPRCDCPQSPPKGRWSNRKFCRS
eukprot:4652780-Alexandrium_andersonii.AAC.1